MLLRESNPFRRAGPREKHLTACIPAGFLYLLWQHSRLISSSNHMVRQKMGNTPRGYLTHNYNVLKLPESQRVISAGIKRAKDDPGPRLMATVIAHYCQCATVALYLHTPTCLCFYHLLTYYLKTMYTVAHSYGTTFKYAAHDRKWKDVDCNKRIPWKVSLGLWQATVLVSRQKANTVTPCSICYKY